MGLTILFDVLREDQRGQAKLEVAFSVYRDTCEGRLCLLGGLGSFGASVEGRSFYLSALDLVALGVAVSAKGVEIGGQGGEITGEAVDIYVLRFGLELLDPEAIA